jgi:hypothetical protein
MIGKLELNFVSPELVTDSSRNVVIQHRRYLVYLFIDRFKHTLFQVYIRKAL